MRRKPVTQATISGKIISRYNSASEAAREDIIIYRSFSMKHSYHYEIIKDMDYDNSIVQPCVPNRSYEEALSAGITECLKIIQE